MLGGGGGFGEWLEEDPIGRLCMLNRRNYTIYGHDWNPMPDMEVDILRGGSYFWKGGLRKGGFGRTPPGYGPDQCIMWYTTISTNYTVTLPVYNVVRHHFQSFDSRGATELTIHCMIVLLLDTRPHIQCLGFE